VTPTHPTNALENASKVLINQIDDPTKHVYLAGMMVLQPAKLLLPLLPASCCC
jgi:hypothetical protein